MGEVVSAIEYVGSGTANLAVSTITFIPSVLYSIFVSDTLTEQELLRQRLHLEHMHMQAHAAASQRSDLGATVFWICFLGVLGAVGYMISQKKKQAKQHKPTVVGTIATDDAITRMCVSGLVLDFISWSL
jgi:hypothetical protein